MRSEKNTVLNFTLLILIVLGIGVRLYSFPHFPAAYNQDEVSAIVESYSLLTTGTDRWGNAWPMYFESWGTGQNVLYSYLSIPFVHLFGLNEYSMRIVALIAGFITILLFYLIARQIRLSTTSTLLGTAIITLLNPYINFFNWGLESQLLLPCWLFFVFTLLKSVHNKWWIVGSFTALSLSLYCYGLAFLWFVPALIAFGLWKRKELRSYMLPSLVGSTLTLFPNLLFLNFLTINYLHVQLFDSAKFGIFTPHFITTRLAESINSDYFSLLFKNLVLLLNGMNNGNFWLTLFPSGIPDVGVVTLSIFAWIYFWQLKKPNSLFSALLFSSVVSLLLSCLLFEINLNRVNVWMGVIVFACLLSLQQLNSTAQKKYLYVTYGILVLCMLVSPLYYFTAHSDRMHRESLVGVTDLIIKANQVEGMQDIYVTSAIPINYVYPIFALATPIQDFQKTALYQKNSAGYYDVTRYKQFVFTPTALKNSSHFLAVLSQDERNKCKNSKQLAEKSRFILAECAYWEN